MNSQNVNLTSKIIQCKWYVYSLDLLASIHTLYYDVSLHFLLVVYTVVSEEHAPLYDAFVQRVFDMRESNNHLIYIKRTLVKHRDQMEHIEESVRRKTTGIDKMETIEIAARNRDIHKCCIVCVISLILDQLLYV